MKSIKVYLYIAIGIMFVVLLDYLAITLKSKKKIEEEWKNAIENCKTYSEQFSTANSNNRALKLTIEQLNASNDSILQQLNDTRNKLKIKDSKVQSMQYISSDFIKNDTVILADTIFRDLQVNIDTLLSDKWYSIRVGLKYPSTIAISPEFKSTKHIIVSSKKETVNPPKKFFLFRLFQKKHTVLNIDVVELNPYIQNEKNRYVEIIE